MSRTLLRQQYFTCDNCAVAIIPGSGTYNAVECFQLSGHTVRELAHLVFCSGACALSAAVRRNGLNCAQAMWNRYCTKIGVPLPIPVLVRKDSNLHALAVAPPIPPTASRTLDAGLDHAAKFHRPAQELMQD